MKIPGSSQPLSSTPLTSASSGSGGPDASAPVNGTARVVFSSLRQSDSVKSIIAEFRSSPDVTGFRSRRSESVHQLRQTMERQFGGDLVRQLFNDRPHAEPTLRPGSGYTPPFGQSDR